MVKMVIISAVLVLLFSCGHVLKNGRENASFNEGGSGGENPQESSSISSPQWQDQVVYFLMIDRFSDGDSSNNDQGSGEFSPKKESHYNGGDLSGITQKLDYIEGLGATSIWITPPVKNVWWSEASHYGGYHGYWAKDFAALDPHVGTLEEYRQLASNLHQRGMYLIQDIVLNHTAPIFEYEGEYHPENTAENFKLLGDPEALFPTQFPFDQADRLNEKHAKAHIYNWTPSISDFNSVEQQTRYQLGNLADLNTRSPEVLKALKASYKYWMKEVGVDAFRVDTAKYVEHGFWHRFFYDEDGIHAEAKRLGKAHFLTFAEVFEFSQPFQNGGEQVIESYYGSESKPEFNSVLGFPLYQSIERVFSEGSAPAQLAYRLQQHMKYADPYTVVNFVDNHDVKRFLAAGSLPNFKQALSLIFTIPGIPVIYQGSEQAHKETRQAMFAGGYMTEEDQYNTESEMYRFIQSLAELRTSHKVLTRGTLSVLDASEFGPGLLAYRRDYQGRSAIIVMNTASHSTLVNGLNTGGASKHLRPNNSWRVAFSEGVDDKSILNQSGRLSMTLPANTVLVLMDDENTSGVITSSAKSSDMTIELDERLSGEVFSEDIEITGSISAGSTEILAITNGNIDTAKSIHSDENGRFSLTFPIRDLGETRYHLQFYSPKYQVASEAQTLTGFVEKASIERVFSDSNNDAFGPSQNYLSPLHENSQKQREIIRVRAKAAGANLSLTLEMAQITHIWGAAKGFDNVSFSIYFNIPSRKTEKYANTIPYINANMPNGINWSLGHILYGWGNYLFEPNLKHKNEKGHKVGLSPDVVVDYAKRTITIHYRGSELDVDDWQGGQIYISTWDMSGEGSYRELLPASGPWHFGGGSENGAKVMDDIFIAL